MSESLSQPPHGGKRAGAGRKPADPKAGNRKKKSFRFAADIVSVLEGQPDQTAYLETAVRFYEDRRP
jgi:hypothetical protein